MAERRQGPWALLARPWVYEALQDVLGAERGRRRFSTEDLHPLPGQSVLDIGCGTAALARYLGPVRYVGYEPNAAYVERGRRENADRDVTLRTGYFDAAAAAEFPLAFDLVVVSAVLHHMNDAEAGDLFRLLAQVVKPEGRVVTLDNVLVPRQNPIARVLINLDRGRNVRSPAGYARLPYPWFADCRGRVLHQGWIPYTFWIMECRLPAPDAAVAAASPHARQDFFGGSDSSA
jgi:SAM-dependent methyltransferase